MSGIPSSIQIQLLNTLEQCIEFDSNSSLREFFTRQEIHPWKNLVPERENVRGRVTAVISKLYDQYRSDRENVLYIFIRLLRDNIDPENNLFQELSNRLQDLEYIRYKNSLQLEKSNTRENLLEANPSNISTIWIAADKKLVNCAQAVARVSIAKFVDRGNTQKTPTGTGWLITPNLALTCHHVIKAREFADGRIRSQDLTLQLENCLFTFNYQNPSEGIEYKVLKLECEDDNLDYALLRLQDRSDEPLQKWGFLHLDRDAPLVAQTNLWIVQHPRGQPQQRSGGRYIKSLSDNKILHDAPTEKGTSGAPILNVTNCNVIAVHNGENEKYQLREATLIKVILVDIEARFPILYKEINLAQQEL
jgi:V8-like Glu-specific endopeptidase